jgi:hypothetical protein
VSPRKSEDESASDVFRRHADSPQPGLLREFWDFLKHNKKWWLVPILLVLLLLGILVVLSGTGIGPFIYPLM